MEPTGRPRAGEGIFALDGFLPVADCVRGVAARLGDAGREIDRGEFADRPGGVAHRDGSGGDGVDESLEAGWCGGGSVVVEGVEEGEALVKKL